MSDFDPDDEPQCLTDYRHGPATGEQAITRNKLRLGYDTHTQTPVIIPTDTVGLFCANCLKETP